MFTACLHACFRVSPCIIIGVLLLIVTCQSMCTLSSELFINRSMSKYVHLPYYCTMMNNKLRKMKVKKGTGLAKDPSSATKETKVQDATDIKINSKQHKSDEDMKMPASKMTSSKREAEDLTDMKMGSKRYKSDHYEDAAAKTCVRLVHKEIVLKPTVKHEEGLQVCGYVPQGEGGESPITS